MFTAVQFPLLLILLAFVLTAIIQSSTAATAIFITMGANGLIGFSSIVFLVFGTHLGTTVTALIAAIPANRNAKRAAVMHLLFNLFGAIIFLPIIWGLSGQFVPWFERLISDPVWQITVFSFSLKLATAIVLLMFIKPTNRLVHFLVKDGPEQIIIDELAEDPFQGFTAKF